MKNLLNITVLIAVATLTVSASALVAERPDPIKGEDGKASPEAGATVKERVSNPLLMAGIATDPVANVNALVGSGHEAAKANLVTALKSSDPKVQQDVASVLQAVGSTDAKLRSQALSELDKGTPITQIATIVGKSVGAQAAMETTKCSLEDTVGRIGSKLSSSEASDLKSSIAAEQADRADHKVSLTEGECGNGLGEYSAPALSNYVKIRMYAKKVHSWTKSTFVKAAKFVLGVSDAQAEQDVDAFINDCHILAPAGA